MTTTGEAMRRGEAEFPPAADERSPRLWFPATVAFCVALSTLLLQLLQTRIYALVYWNHLVYFIVSIALLGFGISGTWLAFGERNLLVRVLSLRSAAVGFVVTTLLSSLLVPQLGVQLQSIFHSTPQFLLMLATYAAAVCPYFFAGWILGSIYRDQAAHMPVLYFADLVGAAVGCVAFLALMQPLGAVRCIVLACLLVAMPILLGDPRRRSSQAILAGLVVPLAAIFLLAPQVNRILRSDPLKAINANFDQLPAGDEKVVELSEWNALSRIDVVSRKDDPLDKRVYIDGDAWTSIVTQARSPAPPFPPEQLFVDHETAYLFHKSPERVLVIGVGGGIDVYLALRAGARHVDGVEINPTTGRLLSNEYRDATHGLANLPGVRTIVEDGRSFVRNTPYRYDVIAMNVVDTLTAMSSGAYVLSETYLYTVDAFMDYISHLKPGGTMCVTRWDYSVEGPRLFSVALEALYRLNVPRPGECILAFAAPYSTVCVRNTPFAPEEVEAARAQVQRYVDGGPTNGPGRFLHPLADGQAHDQQQRIVHQTVKARAQGRQRAYFKSLPLRVDPVYDDNPFFFNYDKAPVLARLFTESDAPDLIRGHWASLTLYVLLVLAGIAVALFMFLPLLRSGRGALPMFPVWLLYFACLGGAFIFVEIALMQRFALLLGHPSRSLALVLAALLFSAGVGSYASASPRLSLRMALGLLSVALLGVAFVYPVIISHALGQPLWIRGALTVLLVVPLGFLMGMPFPTGIRIVSTHGKDSVPWMWAVNGGMSVLGSVLAIIVAILASFTAVLVAAAIGYAVALAAFTVLDRLPHPA